MAFGLMLVLEGILPFMAPQAWRQTFRRLIGFSDGQLRFMGLVSMLGGLIMIIIVNNT
jgi:uncharacterized protein YjeT (DUF2065 family)